MTSSKSPNSISLPAHILDAHISPRAREVLMLLASQTTEENPTIWVCAAAIGEKLRCSPVTEKRAIQKLVEAKLIVETGDLHERRFKFYRVRWSLNEKKSVSACVAKAKKLKAAPVKFEEPRFTQIEHPELMEKPKRTPPLKPTAPIPPPHPGVNHVELLKDSRIAYWAEVARQKHEENLRRYRMELEILNRTNPGEFGEHKEGSDNPHERS